MAHVHKQPAAAGSGLEGKVDYHSVAVFAYGNSVKNGFFTAWEKRVSDDKRNG